MFFIQIYFRYLDRTEDSDRTRVYFPIGALGAGQMVSETAFPLGDTEALHPESCFSPFKSMETWVPDDTLGRGPLKTQRISKGFRSYTR